MVSIDAKNSNSILFMVNDIIIKCYYLKNTREYFMYYINDSGLVPIKHNNINYISNLILENLPQSDNIEVRIRYSSLTSRKKKNQIEHLTKCQGGVNVSYSNVLSCLNMIS